jgi:hypothetical protein
MPIPITTKRQAKFDADRATLEQQDERVAPFDCNQSGHRR